MKIESGVGNGQWAKVDSKNRLHVRSAAFSGEGFEAKEGDSFILHGQCHIAAATSGALLYFKNTSSKYHVHITRIYIDGLSLGDSFIVTQEFDPVRTNGTDIGATGKVNKNRGSANVLEGDLYISDGSSDMTFASGVEYHAFPVQTLSQYMRNMNGSNVLTQNTSIGFGWSTADAGNGVNGELISISVNVYRELV